MRAATTGREQHLDALHDQAVAVVHCDRQQAEPLSPRIESLFKEQSDWFCMVSSASGSFFKGHKFGYNSITSFKRSRY